jgi:hypothetical protein
MRQNTQRLKGERRLERFGCVFEYELGVKRRERSMPKRFVAGRRLKN